MIECSLINDSRPRLVDFEGVYTYLSMELSLRVDGAFVFVVVVDRKSEYGGDEFGDKALSIVTMK
jgi:hypothetical protein